MFSCKFYEIFKNSSFTDQLWANAFVNLYYNKLFTWRASSFTKCKHISLFTNWPCRNPYIQNNWKYLVVVVKHQKNESLMPALKKQKIKTLQLISNLNCFLENFPTVIEIVQSKLMWFALYWYNQTLILILLLSPSETVACNCSVKELLWKKKKKL